LTNLYGPEPITSLICSLASVEARRAGMMNGTLLDGLPRASSTAPKGSLSSSVNVFLSDAASLPVAAVSSLPSEVLLPPALDRHDAVFGGHGLAIVELEPVAQRERPLHVVAADGVPVHHLRLDLEARVAGEQRVVDEIGVVPGDVGRGPDRVEDLQVRDGDDADGAPALLRVDERRAPQGAGADQELPAADPCHDCSFHRGSLSMAGIDRDRVVATERRVSEGLYAVPVTSPSTRGSAIPERPSRSGHAHYVIRMITSLTIAELPVRAAAANFVRATRRFPSKAA